MEISDLAEGPTPSSVRCTPGKEPGRPWLNSRLGGHGAIVDWLAQFSDKELKMVQFHLALLGKSTFHSTGRSSQ
jgi:hypothetical protein